MNTKSESRLFTTVLNSLSTDSTSRNKSTKHFHSSRCCYAIIASLIFKISERYLSKQDFLLVSKSFLRVQTFARQFAYSIATYWFKKLFCIKWELNLDWASIKGGSFSYIQVKDLSADQADESFERKMNALPSWHWHKTLPYIKRKTLNSLGDNIP